MFIILITGELCFPLHFAELYLLSLRGVRTFEELMRLGFEGTCECGRVSWDSSRDTGQADWHSRPPGETATSAKPNDGVRASPRSHSAYN